MSDKVTPLSASISLSFPRLCGLLAEKPTTLSLAMHNAGYRALGLDTFCYVAFDTVDTRAAVGAMRTLGIRGFSLTIPHKETALELVDSLSLEAKAIGAVNTVVNDGKFLIGENTDWFGICEALREKNVSVKAKRALILGAGGAACAAVHALKSLGAGSISIVNRSPERGKAVADRLKVEALRTSIDDTGFEGYDLIVNATPAGSHLAPAIDLKLRSKLSSNHTFFDLVTYKTGQFAAAEAAGATCIEGSRMLLHQALRQFELFTGEKAPREAMERALLIELSKPRHL